jgi:hypothetical protein
MSSGPLVPLKSVRPLNPCFGYLEHRCLGDSCQCARLLNLTKLLIESTEVGRLATFLPLHQRLYTSAPNRSRDSLPCCSRRQRRGISQYRRRAGHSLLAVKKNLASVHRNGLPWSRRTEVRILSCFAGVERAFVSKNEPRAVGSAISG